MHARPELREPAVRIGVREERIPAHPQIQRQPTRDLPVVLHVSADFQIARPVGIGRDLDELVRQAQQQVRGRVAAGVAVEGDRGIGLEILPQGQQVAAEVRARPAGNVRRASS